jgi:hypothetical protein
MRGVSNLAAWLTAGLLACAVQTGAADSAVPAPVAQSALVTLEAASTPAGLTLHLHRTAGTAPLAVTELTVTIDGKSTPATRAADGSWSIAWPHPGERRESRLEVVVAHDGIREVLSGSVSPPAAGGAARGGASGMLRDHKQMAWWILNIAVVLIAAIAISRRMS